MMGKGHSKMKITLRFLGQIQAAILLWFPMQACTDYSQRMRCATNAAGCVCGIGDACDLGLTCDQGICVEVSAFETDTGVGGDTDADSDADGNCSYTCVTSGTCTGTRHPAMTCAANQMCCDMGGSDGDADTDADADADGDTKFVGNITTAGQVRQDFLQYWDQITPENEGKWGSVENVRDNMNWSGVQTAYNFAEKNGIPFKQHTFVWGSQYPTWIDSLGSSEQAAEIEEWISQFCTKFPNTALIDVVNEAIAGHKPANYAKNAFGNNWIIRSFELAHQYCPNAVLILNDYNVLRWNTADYIALATPVIASGYMDAVGCQGHGLGGGSLGIQQLSELKANLNQIIALGVDIYITEYDIEQTDDQSQLQVMQEQFPLFYETPEIKGITYWGYVVGSTWRTGTGLLNTNGTPRPALIWLMDYLGR
jgi:GH35 family endo-1,4-beta-xylanase